MGDPTAPDDTPTPARPDDNTLVIADELGKLAYGLAAAATALNGPDGDDGYGGDTADGLRAAAAAADQLGRIAYANAYGDALPKPRVAPGFFAERIYGPGLDDVGRHAAPTPGTPGAPVPFEGQAALAARAVIDAAMGIPPYDIAELITRLRATGPGRDALLMLARHFDRGGAA
jgi:hypothetical protein